LDEELFSYRYSSCSSHWDDQFKALASWSQNRLGMKFDRSVLQVNTHWLT